MRSHKQNIPLQNSKLLAERNVEFNSEKFLIYVLPKFIETLYVLVVIYIT